MGVLTVIRIGFQVWETRIDFCLEEKLTERWLDLRWYN